MDWTACVGVDWGDKEHAYVIDDHGKKTTGVIGSTPEELHGWARELRQRFPVGSIFVAIEQGRGGVLYALSMYDFIVLLPINPRASKAYRDSQRLSGASSDGSDAALICDFAVKHLDTLRVWKPDDPLSRTIRLMAETRRDLVDDRTRYTHKLAATLKEYFPQPLQWFGGESSKLLWAMIGRWSTLANLRLATPAQLTITMKGCRCRNITKRVNELSVTIKSAVALTNDVAIIRAEAMHAEALVALLEPLEEQIRTYDRAIAEAWATHPDHALFASLPGAGPVLAPRLAVGFGTDRDRYEAATDLQCYSGIAPVTEQSGKTTWTHVRFGCPKFLRQSFHEFASASMPYSPWAKAVYDEQRARGAKHNEAVRALAFRWMRILFHLWKERKLYDEQRHLDNLAIKKSPILRRLAA